MKSRPYPWKCYSCGKKEVVPAIVEYSTVIPRGGREYSIFIKNLPVDKCNNCGEMLFDNRSDDLIQAELKAQIEKGKAHA